MIGALVEGLLIHFDYSRFVAYGIPAFFITVIFALTDNKTIKGKIMRGAVFIGDASYSIYLTHYYFAFFKPKLLLIGTHFSFNKEIFLNITDMMFFLLSIISGCLFYLYVEKPIISYFSNKTKVPVQATINNII